MSVRYVLTVVIMSAEAAIGGATALLGWPVWGFLVAAVVFAIGMATWPRRAGGDGGGAR